MARKLRKSSAKVQKFLNFCQKNLKKSPWEYSLNGNTISYKVPKFIDLSSNWTKRQHKTPTEAPTEAPLKKRTTEEEERIKKKNKRFNQKDFNLFINTYPNRKEKKAALVRWKVLLKSGELPLINIIINAIKEQIQWRALANGEFRPEWKNPATWLNKGCWEDEVSTPPDHKPITDEQEKAELDRDK